MVLCFQGFFEEGVVEWWFGFEFSSFRCGGLRACHGQAFDGHVRRNIVRESALNSFSKLVRRFYFLTKKREHRSWKKTKIDMSNLKIHNSQSHSKLSMRKYVAFEIICLPLEPEFISIFYEKVSVIVSD